MVAARRRVRARGTGGGGVAAVRRRRNAGDEERRRAERLAYADPGAALRVAVADERADGMAAAYERALLEKVVPLVSRAGPRESRGLDAVADSLEVLFENAHQKHPIGTSRGWRFIYVFSWAFIERTSGHGLQLGTYALVGNNELLTVLGTADYVSVKVLFGGTSLSYAEHVMNRMAVGADPDAIGSSGEFVRRWLLIFRAYGPLTGWRP